MFLSHSWQTLLVHIDSDAVKWSCIFNNIVIQHKNSKIWLRKVILSIFFISSEHTLNINQFSAKVGSFYYKIYAKYNQITGCGFYTTQ